jgi:hypothetical protein
LVELEGMVGFPVSAALVEKVVRLEDWAVMEVCLGLGALAAWAVMAGEEEMAAPRAMVASGTGAGWVERHARPE